MLLYAIQRPGFDEYNKRYLADDHLFDQLAPQNITFIQKIANLIVSRQQLDVLDVGCGQGQFTSLVRNYLETKRGDSSSNWQKPRVVGVDGASAAIQQAEKRDPSVIWINDSLEYFLAQHDTHLDGLRYDLIIDRCGATVLNNEEEGVRTVNQLHALLKPDSFYTYIVSKSWYEKATGTVPPPHLTWTRDWISILKTRYEACNDMSESGYLQLAFVK